MNAFAEKPDLVVLPGFTKIISPTLITYFADKIVNIHLAYPEHVKGDVRWKRLYALYQETLERIGSESMICGPSACWISGDVDSGTPIAHGLLPFHQTMSYAEFHTRMWLEEIAVTTQALAAISNERQSPSIESGIQALLSQEGIASVNLVFLDDGCWLKTDRGDMEMCHEKGYSPQHLRHALATTFITLARTHPARDRRYYIHGHELICQELGTLEKRIQP